MDDRIAALEVQVAGLLAAMADRDALLAERDALIAELEKLLDESRCGGKRQAAPFSKGEPNEDPKRPGRKTRQAARHHRQAIDLLAQIDARLALDLGRALDFRSQAAYDEQSLSASDAERCVGYGRRLVDAARARLRELTGAR